MFKFEHVPKKIEYSIEDKVNFYFLQTNFFPSFSNLEVFFLSLFNYAKCICNSSCKFASKIIMFQDASQFKDVIIFYYKGQNIVKISWKV